MGIVYLDLQHKVHRYVRAMLALDVAITSVYDGSERMKINVSPFIDCFISSVKNHQPHNMYKTCLMDDEYNVIYISEFHLNAYVPIGDRELTANQILVNYLPTSNLQYEIKSEEQFFQYSTVLDIDEIVGWMILTELYDLGVDRSFAMEYNAELSRLDYIEGITREIRKQFQDQTAI